MRLCDVILTLEPNRSYWMDELSTDIGLSQILYIVIALYVVDIGQYGNLKNILQKTIPGVIYNY